MFSFIFVYEAGFVKEKEPPARDRALATLSLVKEETMKTKKSKLTLNRETLRSLARQEVAAAVGGATFPCGSNSCPMACGPTEVASCTSCVCGTD